MKRFRKWMAIWLGLVCSFFVLHSQNEPAGLICNLLVRPELTVITTSRPQFGWVLPPDRENSVQSAYRILVASSLQNLNKDQGDLWDSGKKRSGQSQHIAYQGKDLQPGLSYFWKVAFWNSKGELSGFSNPQQFNTGEFGYVPLWPGESRWVKISSKSGDSWTFEDRNPIAYHTVYPQMMRKMGNNTWFIDFGRSAFSYASFNIDWPVNEPQKEKQIKVRIGEKAIGDSIDRQPGGGVLCKEYVLTIRPGSHTYELQIPRFVSSYPHSQVMPPHMQEVIPFRYCELESDDPSISLISAKQLALHTVFDKTASSFTSSSEMLNRIYDLCRYSVIANTFNGDYAASQRERMMYEADSYIHQMGHYAVDREFSVARYSLKNMIFHATWPTEWISHTLMMAWADYQHTGDKEVIKQFYAELKPKTLMALTAENGLISTRTGLQSEGFLKSIHFKGKELKDIVDWPHGSMSSTLKGGETDAYDFQDYNTVVNAFHYHSLVLMAEIAEAVGEKKDAGLYSKQAERVKKAFNQNFIDSGQGIYVDGIGSSHSSLHSNLFALAFGLVPEPLKVSVKAFIKSKGMACGVYGANYLLETLFDEGEADYALSLITATTDRSWYNMIRVGSTITTEAWDNKYKTNNGWSHAWSSSPAHIIPRKLMGIEPLTPGFETIRIKPRPASLEQAEMKLPTIRGEVKASFVNKQESFMLNVLIPGNTKAHVYLPVRGEIASLLVDKTPVKRYKQKDGYVLIEGIGSGDHQFEISFK